MDGKDLNAITRDTMEVITLLQQLSREEKREIKGIMTGITMAKQTEKKPA